MDDELSPNDPEFKRLDSGIVQMTVKLDMHDWRDLTMACYRRAGRLGSIPDAVHDDASWTGCVLAEICRGWMEFTDQIDEVP